jgi:probable F420-dependent oxidoreductase
VAHERRIRFAMQLTHASTGQQWKELARRAEVEGYDVVSLPDHLGDQFGPIAALAAVAAVTDSVRLSMFVLANDLRHPAVLAKEITTLDVISEGRVELGLGAGWSAAEFGAMGIPFDPPGTRIGRLQEAVALLKALFSGQSTNFEGRYYRAVDFDLRPRPVRPSGIPLVLGGGGRTMLALAAREADIVSVSTDNRSRTAAGALNDSIGWPVVSKQIDWIREVAGPRFDELELNFRVLAIAVTDDRAGAAAQLSRQFGSSPEVLLDSPFVFVGTRQQIEDQIYQTRVALGVSYYTISQRHADQAAPLVTAVAGQ